MVTGATSGFGYAIAERFASEGWNVIITGRRHERLIEQKKTWSMKYGVDILPLCFDVRNRNEVESVLNALPELWKQVDVLVNNAGLALGRNPIDEGNELHWEQMIDTNLKGMLYVSQQVIPWFKTRMKGTIINIGSIAGKEAYAGGNVYSATKFAVDGLTKSMRIDLLPYHIKVCQIAPGAAETEFSLVRFEGDQSKANAVYEGFIPLSASDVADAAWYVASRPAHVCIQDLVIMPTAQANATTFLKS